MSSSPRLGFGGFLLGLGVGWYLFTTLEISGNVFAWLLILAGAGMIFSTLISWKRPGLNTGGLVSGLVGGLILSLFLTSGFGIIGDMTRVGVSLTYRAEDTKSFSGTMTAGSVYLEVDNFNGPIRVSTWDRAEYNVELTIKARTEEDLDDLKMNFDESGTQDEKRLTLRYDIPPTERSRYAIEVDVFLPADAMIDLDLDSSNGGIYLNNIVGDSLIIDTSNGEIVFENVLAERIIGDTSNGRIRGELEAPDTSLSTSNGKIDLTIPCTVSGEYELSTSNGAIELIVSPSAQIGYDLDLSTSNAGIDIDLSDLDYSQNQRTRKVAKTDEFNEKAVKIAIKASTSNAGIDVGT